MSDVFAMLCNAFGTDKVQRQAKIAWNTMSSESVDEFKSFRADSHCGKRCAAMIEATQAAMKACDPCAHVFYIRGVIVACGIECFG